MAPFLRNSVAALRRWNTDVKAKIARVSWVQRSAISGEPTTPWEARLSVKQKGYSMRSILLAFVAAALVAAGPAIAGKVELGGYWGYGWLDEYGGLNLRDGSLYGGRLGYFLGSRTSLEFSAQKLPTETDFDLPVPPNTDANVSAYRLNLLYHLSGGGVQPFLTGGIGSEKVSVEDDGESSDFGWNVGGGLRFLLSRRVNLRVDGAFTDTEGNRVSMLQPTPRHGGGTAPGAKRVQ